MLMYHSIIAEIKNNDTSDLKTVYSGTDHCFKFWKPRVLSWVCVRRNRSLFYSNSPKAIKEAASLISDATDIETNAIRGNSSNQLFFFPLPSDKEKQHTESYRHSDTFALNSQAAMMFYEAGRAV